MTFSIRPEQPVNLRIAFPEGVTCWPLPPAWAPSDPAIAIVLLSNDEQNCAMLTVFRPGDVTVSVAAGMLRGTSDIFHVHPASVDIPPNPVEINLT